MVLVVFLGNIYDQVAIFINLWEPLHGGYIVRPAPLQERCSVHFKLAQVLDNIMTEFLMRSCFPVNNL